MVYTAGIRSPNGKVRNITIEAPTRDRAAILAAGRVKRGESVSFVREGKGNGKFKGKMLNLNVISDFCLDLSELLSGSNSFVDSLGIIAKTNESKAVREMAGRMIEREKGGADASANFEAERDYLGQVVVSLAIQGEASHSLAENLENASKIIDRQVKQTGVIIKALAMPGIAIAVLVAVSCMAFGVLIPNLRAQMGSRVTPNPITHIAYFLSDALTNFWLLWVIMAGVLLYLLFFTKILHKITLNFLIRNVQLARRAFVAAEHADFCMLLGSLLARGIAMKESLQCTALRFAGSPLSKQILKAAEAVSLGSGVYEAMNTNTTLDPKTLSAFRVGEKSGDLGNHLVRYAERLYYRSDRAFDKFSNIVSVTAIVAMALMVIFTFVSAYGPLLQYLQENMSGRN